MASKTKPSISSFLLRYVLYAFRIHILTLMRTVYSGFYSATTPFVKLSNEGGRGSYFKNGLRQVSKPTYLVRNVLLIITVQSSHQDVDRVRVYRRFCAGKPEAAPIADYV